MPVDAMNSIISLAKESLRFLIIQLFHDDCILAAVDKFPTLLFCGFDPKEIVLTRSERESVNHLGVESSISKGANSRRLSRYWKR